MCISKKDEIEDLIVVESQLDYILKNEKLQTKQDKEVVRRYANKMVLVTSYLLEFKELESCLEPLSDIDCDNVKAVSEKKFNSELKKWEHNVLYDGYFLKFAKLKCTDYEESPQYLLFTRSVPR